MRTQAVMALAVVALGAVPAVADMPPPATYVETCTISKQQKAGAECATCAAYHGDTTRCTRLLSPYCYTKVCKTWGASVWSDVLCRTASPDAPVVPSEVVNILGDSMTAGPASQTADGGMPSTCAAYPPPPDTTSATSTETTSSTQTASSTQTESSTASATDVKTDSKTTSNTETQSTSVTASATDTQSATASQPSSATATSTSTVSSTVPDTSSSTSTQTTSSSTPTESKSQDDSSGCNVATGTSPAYRALGPLGLVLAGLALFLLRRRPRR